MGYERPVKVVTSSNSVAPTKKILGGNAGAPASADEPMFV
jgi:hypothetical protein